ncbi:MAG: ABC transporter permease, partial [Alphaproteobacteria bacterium]
MRSEPLRGYTLLSPTLLIMAFGICIPFAILITMSFWTQHGFDFDTTLSLRNYGKAFEHPVYEALMLR